MDMRSRSALLRDSLLEARDASETARKALVAALDGEESAVVVALWPSFASDLSLQLDAEEAYVLSTPDQTSSRDVRLLLHEHRHLRARLSEVGESVDRGDLREVSAFLLELEAHAQSEARRGWARELGESEPD